MFKRTMAAAIAYGLCHVAMAADEDPCKRFKWDATHEVAVMKQAAQPVTAATQPRDIPQLQLEKPFEVKLADQSTVTFAAPPGKPTLPDGTRAGLVRFSTREAGRYRVAMTSGHWIDVVDGKALIASRDFNGAHGCERPRKIVEFDLPGHRDLTLQLSGAADTPVTLAVTFVPASSGQ